MLSPCYVERVTVAGFGGQGVMVIGQMIAYLANEANYNTLWYPSYGPETRGGTANCSVCISAPQINSPVFAKADTVIAMNGPSLEKFLPTVKDTGCLLYNSSLIERSFDGVKARVIGIPVNDIAARLGNVRVANTIMLGAYLEVCGYFTDEVIEKIINKFFAKKASLIPLNMQAIAEGRKFVRELA